MVIIMMIIIAVIVIIMMIMIAVIVIIMMNILVKDLYQVWHKHSVLNYRVEAV